MEYESFELHCFSYYLHQNDEIKEEWIKRFMKLKCFMKYPNLFKVLRLFDNISDIRNFKDYIYSKINLGDTYDKILNENDLPDLHDYIRYILDILLTENDDLEDNIKDDSILDSSEDVFDESRYVDIPEEEELKLHYHAESVTTDNSNNDIEDENEITFEWKGNQIEGIENAKACDYACGIHTQATGCGKSYMALKIISDYNEKYPHDNIMWLCERIDIPEKLFFKKTETGVFKFNRENFRNWKKWNIIDMDKFDIINFVSNKPRNWTSILNKESVDNKPKFIIVNRAFVTTKSKQNNITYRYQEINQNQSIKFVIHDECHSTYAPLTYKLLSYMKNRWDTRIQGLSATPYRDGMTRDNGIILDGEDENRQNSVRNINRLIDIYPKPGNPRMLHILSKCDLKEAIENNYILEPVFHWFYVDNYSRTNKSLNDDEFESMMSALNKMITDCVYRKVIIWCSYVELAETMYHKFNDKKIEYENLVDLSSYLYHSKRTDSDDYDSFYMNPRDCVMFCAKMFREGSDIPNLCGGLFLDKVKERGDIPFIQSIGRVLRKDDKNIPNGFENPKKNGHILDFFLRNKDNLSGAGASDDDNNHTKIQMILNKLIKYYLKIYELSFMELENTEYSADFSKMKIRKYMEIMNSFCVNPESQMMEIHLKNNKKIGIDISNLEIYRLDWSLLMREFHNTWRRHFNFTDEEDFMKLKHYVKDMNLESKEEYIEICNSENNFPSNPEEVYRTFWKGWYNFLGTDISIFPRNKNEWKNICEKNNITTYEQYKLLMKNLHLPLYPNEIYGEFSNINLELTGRRQLFMNRR